MSEILFDRSLEISCHPYLVPLSRFHGLSLKFASIVLEKICNFSFRVLKIGGDQARVLDCIRELLDRIRVVSRSGNGIRFCLSSGLHENMKDSDFINRPQPSLIYNFIFFCKS